MKHLACALVVTLGLANAAHAGGQTLILGTHERVPVETDVTRVAVGDPNVISVDLLTSRELLVLGKQVGRTSLVLWHDGGVVTESTWRVERDLSVLRSALAEIDPGIRAESAPDRDAIVLRGFVPDVRYARAAEAAARSYLEAGGSAAPLVQGGPRDGSDAASPAPGSDAVDGAAPQAADDTGFTSVRGAEGIATGGGGVINLIRVEALPAPLEERIAEVIGPLGGSDVTVRRVVRGEIPDDAIDTFVLEGKVTNQIALTRVLLAASHLAGGSSGDIGVLANEAGGLGGGGGAGAASGGVSTLSRIGSISGAGFGSRGGGGGGGTALSENVARASALTAGGGRILAFLDVEDLPQVRVEARIYEVNRSRLRSWNPEIDALGGDFDQPELLPSLTGLRAQGANAARVGSPDAGDIQGALSLIGGALTQQWQVVASHFAVDVLFSLLEDRGIARSLAQPAITVLSGETASFQAGGQIPINVAIETQTSAATNAALFSSVVFADFGVNLSVRPLVGLDDVVTLDVTPDVSSPDLALTQQIADATGQDQATTAFQTRSLHTSTRLRDGQALLIGGLLSQSQTETTRATPGLHQVPGLGWLAKSFDRQADEEEVVIVVTPAIVREPIPAAPLWAFPETAELLDPTAGNSARLGGTNMEEEYEP
jgi:Flp pilus assembly secretin CpaC